MIVGISETQYFSFISSSCNGDKYAFVDEAVYILHTCIIFDLHHQAHLRTQAFQLSRKIELISLQFFRMSYSLIII